MNANRIAALVVFCGATTGVAAAQLVPTGTRRIEAVGPIVKMADYPEITATTFESYPIAVAPLFHQHRLKMAEWEQPLPEPLEPVIPPAEDYEPDHVTPVVDLPAAEASAAPASDEAIYVSPP